MKRLLAHITLFLTVVLPGQARETPNILFIFSDDLSFRDLSAYGQQRFQTPNLDRLAANSTRFTQAYTGAPECAPSRSTLLTGLHVGRSPIRLNSSARGFEPLPADTFTFAHLLQKAGYKTGVVGKWGLGYKDSTGQPLAQGFDYHFGYLTHYEAHSYFPLVLYENNRNIPLPGNEQLVMEPLYEKDDVAHEYSKYYDDEGKLVYVDLDTAVYASDLFDQKAEQFIETNQDDPFFLYFTTNLPHGPTIIDDLRQLADDHDMSLHAREWGAMVERLDIAVGRLIDTLKAKGLYENTLIVFASDNGYTMENDYTLPDGTHVWPDNPDLENKGPFHGGKFTALEGGMRIPFFMKLPGQTKPKIISEPVWLVDLFPTFAAITGQPVPEGLDGYNLLPLIEGDRNTIPADRVLYFYKKNEQAIRQGPWFAFREHPEKPVELYLMEEDLAMARDLSKLYPDKADELGELMDAIHEPHDWYWNPGDTDESFAAKKALAKEKGLDIKAYRPNHMELMPWERK